MNHPDHNPYFNFTKPQRFEKAVHTLEGILKGIAIDGRVLPAECKELVNWCREHQDMVNIHPFTELIPKVKAALADGVIDPEEEADILWVCGNLMPKSVHFNAVTTELQILHGMLHGILADGIISEEEVLKLRDWVEEHQHLRMTYPFAELDSLLTTVLADQKVTTEEQAMLKEFFEDFISYSMSRRIQQARDALDGPKPTHIRGVCAVCPEIEFPEKVFCFTGASSRGPRREITEHVVCRRGDFSSSVTKGVDYLVVGAAGNPCWAFSCYGRKVEQAVLLRRAGSNLLIVHENDFWDAVLDVPV